jgi:uncharacterized repeat protein (TIGR03803 family)
MKKTIRERESEWKEKPDRTVGVDLGDRFSHYCVLNGDGEVMEEGRMRTSEEAFRRHWEAEPRQRIVMETGTHSPWISRLLRGFGHQVILLAGLAAVPLSRAQTYTVLYSFTGGTDGEFPAAGLIQDSVGNLYGTTSYGNPPQAGSVFKLSPSGKFKVLH